MAIKSKWTPQIRSSVALDIWLRIIFKKVKLQLTEILEASSSNLNWFPLFLRSFYRIQFWLNFLCGRFSFTPNTLQDYITHGAQSCTFQACMNGYTFQTYFVLTIGPPSSVKILMRSLQDYYGCDVVSQDYIKYVNQFSTLSQCLTYCASHQTQKAFSWAQ